MSNEKYIVIKTNKIENFQLDAIRCNKLLKFNKLHSHYSLSSSSYVASYFNSMYTPLVLSISIDGSKSDTRGMDTKSSNLINIISHYIDNCSVN